MVVVADSGLETRRSPGGLDAPDQAGSRKGAQHVVHRLGRDGTQPLASARGKFLDRQMPSPANGGKDSEAWRGHAQSSPLQVLEISRPGSVVLDHGATLAGLKESKKQLSQEWLA
jgi:hypothetical protein